MWPQWIFLVLLVLNLGIAIEKHRDTRSSIHNFWVDLAGAAIIFGLLYFGGFWKGLF